MQTTDVTIIGAGPVGLFSIFQCGMMSLKCHVIDALSEVGGQCRALYPEKPIYDIPAHPHILAGALVDNLEAQARPFDPVYHLSQHVQAIEELDPEVTDGYRFKVTTNTGTEITTRTIIIAAGVGAFGPNRPPLDSIEIYENKSVHYFVRNTEMYRGKNIVIAGGGDSAVDWAIILKDIAQKVYFVHRRNKFRAHPESVKRLHQIATDTPGSLEIVVPYQLSSLAGQDGILRQVTIAQLSGETRCLDADYLLPFFGLSTDLGPIADWGLALDRMHITVDPTTCRTNKDGIYAVGDVATYNHKLKLILTGFSEAAFAAQDARMLIYPDQVFHFEYSTTSGVPGRKSA